MSLQVMLDIETLGKGVDALILSIGAVKFDPETYAPGLDAFTGVVDRFYVPIDPVSAVALGGKLDADTVMWWMSGDRDEARKQMLGEERLDIASALEGFALWLGSKSLPVWGNGATFDNVIVRRAFERAGIECPWSYLDDRCHRTLKNLLPGVVPPRTGTYHNALDDAEWQVGQFLMVTSALGIAL